MKYIFCALLFLQTFCFSTEVILLIGSPGSGKGTFSQFAKAQGYGHVSIGDIIRKEISKGSHVGLGLVEMFKQQGFIDANTFFQLIKGEILHRLEQNIPVIIDGCGENPQEWKLLRSFFQEINATPRLLILDAPTSVCRERMTNRLACWACGYTTSNQFDTLGSSCPRCHTSKLAVRMQETENLIDTRLKHYKEIEPKVLEAFADFPQDRYDTHRCLEECYTHYLALLQSWKNP